MSQGRPSKLIRNTGNGRTVTYGGRDYQFPGNGDTTMVSAEVADFVEQNFGRDGLLVVHPEHEASERAAEAAAAEALAAKASADAEAKRIAAEAEQTAERAAALKREQEAKAEETAKVEAERKDVDERKLEESRARRQADSVAARNQPAAGRIPRQDPERKKR
jgi:hypothetical protein